MTLTRPSIVPLYLEDHVINQVTKLLGKTRTIQLFVKSQIDAFVTESGVVHFGAPVDLDLSPAILRIINELNNTLHKIGLTGFHDQPNPHISFASAGPEELEKLAKNHVLEGPTEVIA